MVRWSVTAGAAGLLLVPLSTVIPAAAAAVAQSPAIRSVERIHAAVESADPTVASLGYSVSISGNMAIVGAPGVKDGTGAVFMFRRSASGWRHLGMIADPRNQGMDEFGWSVAISGTTIAIGATDDNSNYDIVYVYFYSGTKWHLRAMLTDPGGSSQDNFGSSVSIDGPTLVVGAPCAGSHSGITYIYRNSPVGWKLRDTLRDPDPDVAAEFGYATAVSGTQVLVSAEKRNSEAGIAYIYTRAANGTWPRQATLADPGGHSGDEFGYSVAISNSAAVIGAPGASGRGLAYVYMHSGHSWKRQAKLANPRSETGKNLGLSVSISGNRTLVGVPVGGPKNCGLALDYARSRGKWRLVDTVVGQTCASGEKFGFSVGLSGRAALIGAPNSDAGIGAFYVIDVR